MSSEPGLNPEPADPRERKENHLPPKSYADAAVENPGTNGTVNGDTRPGYDRQESSHEYSAEVRTMWSAVEQWLIVSGN